MSPLDWPLDRCLELLRAGGLTYRGDEEDPGIWWSVCPACLSPEWSLRIRECRRGGPVSLWCKGGCSEQEILQALKDRPGLLAVQEREMEALALAEAASQIGHRALELLHRELAEPTVLFERRAA